MHAPPRSHQQRLDDTERLLETEIDVWVATASGDTPHMVPLSFHWDGCTLLLSTSARSRTARNLRDGAQVRVALGQVRDLCLIDGEVEVLEIDAVERARADAFATRCGFDPRTLTTRYLWFRLTPRRVQAWRNENEIAGRTLMTDGRWREQEQEHR